MSGKALKLIQPVSKRDQVVALFKEAILSGIIQPGESIVESKVAQQLGAGIPLVRNEYPVECLERIAAPPRDKD